MKINEIVSEGEAIPNPKNTFLSKSDTAYDFIRVGKSISNLSNAKKSDNRDEPDVMIVPFGGKKEKDHLKKGLKKAGYKTQDADKPGDDAQVDENFAEGYKLQLERDKEMLVLNITDTASGKRTEVRGKPGYETGNYDPSDKLHQLLDKVGKSADISQLMNGEPVGINPKHPDGASAKDATDKAYKENSPIGMSKDTAVALGKMSKDTGKAIDKYQQTNTSGKTSRAFTDIEDEYLDIRKLAMKLIKNGLDPYVAYYKASEKMQFDPAMVFDWMGSEYKDEELEDFIPVEYERDWIKRAELGMTENFADGKKKGKSRPGRVKKSGASCKGSVTDLRKRAKGASGEKRKMYHWCANMKSGKK